MELLSEDAIHSMCMDESQYDLAYDFLTQDLFYEAKLTKASEHSIMMELTMKDFKGKIYRPVVEVCENGGSYTVKDYHCDCRQFGTARGMCAHVAAAIMEIDYTVYEEDVEDMLVREIGEEEVLYDESDEDGYSGEPYFSSADYDMLQQALKNLENVGLAVATSSGRTFGTSGGQMAAQTSAKLASAMEEVVLEERNRFCQEVAQGDVSLEVTLHVEPDTEYVDLRIGKKQMYVVKSIRELASNIREQKFVRYGKNLEFVHTQSAFSRETQPLLQFLLNVPFPKETYGYYYSYYRHPAENKRNLSLDGRQLEELFTILEEYPHQAYVEVPKTCEKIPLVFRREDPMLKVSIKGDKNKRAAHIKMPQILLLEGNTCSYIYWYQTVYICTEEYIQAVKNILPLMCMNYMRAEREDMGYVSFYKRNDDFMLTERDYASFASTLLPIMEKYMDVEIRDVDFEQYQAEDGTYNLYLDLDGQNSVVCKAEAVYGEKKHNLIRPATLSETYRNIRIEYELRTLLSQYFPWKTQDGMSYLLANDDERLAALVQDGVEQLQNLAQVYASEAFRGIRIAAQPHITTGLSMKGNLLHISWDAEGMSSQELAEILHSYQQKRKYHRLRSGELLNLQNSALEALSDMQMDLQLTKAQLQAGMADVPMYRTLYLESLMKDNARKISFEKDEMYERLLNRFDSIQEEDISLPDAIVADMRSYQMEGYRWASALSRLGFGGILADDMGLGKTVQMIACLCNETEETHLVVCPASLVYNWEAEFQKFAPSKNVCPIVGNASERAGLLSGYKDYDVIVTSYDLLKRDIEWYQDKEFGYQIIDEAQYIKNPTTQAAKAVKAVKSRVRFALTGTPIENRLSELWSIFEYLMPGYLHGYQTFRKNYEEKIVAGGKEEEHALERLQHMIRPFVLRRLKQDVLDDLPDKVEEVVYAKFDSGQEKLYRAVEKNIIVNLKKKSDKEFQESKIQILAELTRLRQICCDPSLIYENYTKGSAKLDVCMEFVENAIEGGHRILLFSQFTTMLDVIRQQLDKKNIRSYTLTGSTSKLKRRELVEKFQQGKADVFLISLKAGGTGLNLTAADIVLHYDPWWNVAAQNQATDRAHRIGQENKVTVIKLIAKGTIEERILKLQERKQDLADKIISGEGMSVSSFTKEELLELFGQD